MVRRPRVVDTSLASAMAGPAADILPGCDPLSVDQHRDHRGRHHHRSVLLSRMTMFSRSAAVIGVTRAPAAAPSGGGSGRVHRTLVSITTRVTRAVPTTAPRNAFASCALGPAPTSSARTNLIWFGNAMLPTEMRGAAPASRRSAQTLTPNA